MSSRTVAPIKHPIQRATQKLANNPAVAVKNLVASSNQAANPIDHYLFKGNTSGNAYTEKDEYY